MNKRRLGRPVLTEAGVAARVTNAAEWEAPPGMEKRRCRRCQTYARGRRRPNMIGGPLGGRAPFSVSPAPRQPRKLQALSSGGNQSLS
jgi:hypothetical protein